MLGTAGACCHIYFLSFGLSKHWCAVGKTPERGHWKWQDPCHHHPALTSNDLILTLTLPSDGTWHDQSYSVVLILCWFKELHIYTNASNSSLIWSVVSDQLDSNWLLKCVVSENVAQFASSKIIVLYYLKWCHHDVSYVEDCEWLYEQRLNHSPDSYIQLLILLLKSQYAINSIWGKLHNTIFVMISLASEQVTTCLIKRLPKVCVNLVWKSLSCNTAVWM